MKNVFAVASIAVIFLISACGGEDVVTDGITEEEEIPLSEDETEVTEEIEKKPVGIDIPEHIREVMDRLEQGMEEKDVMLYLDAFWPDDYYYHSDSTTDDPWDDVIFDDIKEEQDSIQRLFDGYDSFDVKFEAKEFTEVDAEECKLRSHYGLLVSIKPGMSLPGGFEQMYAEGDNIFTFKKHNREWRISRWEQEEMSQDEIWKECVEHNICPPAGVLFNAWGMLKLQ